MLDEPYLHSTVLASGSLPVPDPGWLATRGRPEPSVKKITNAVCYPSFLRWPGSFRLLAMWPAPGIRPGAIAAAMLGVILAAYLWLHAGTRSVAGLAGVVVTAIFSHFLIVSLAPFALLLSVFGSIPSRQAFWSRRGGRHWSRAASRHLPRATAVATAIAGFRDRLVRDRRGAGLFCLELQHFMPGVTVLQMPLWNGGVAGAPRARDASAIARGRLPHEDATTLDRSRAGRCAS